MQIIVLLRLFTALLLGMFFQSMLSAVPWYIMYVLYRMEMGPLPRICKKALK